MAYLKARGKKKIWTIIYYNRITGKQSSESTGTNNKAIANQKLKEFLARQDEKMMIGAGFVEAVTISEAFELYKQSTTLAPSTEKLLDLCSSHLVRALEQDKKLSYISPRDGMLWERYLIQLTVPPKKPGGKSHKASPNTRRIFSAHVAAVFNWLVKKRYIPSHPFEKMKGEPKQVRAIPIEEIETIIAAFDKSPHQFIVKFLLLTGRRVGELCSLKTSDINTTRKEIRFRNHKARKDLILPVIAPLEPLLEQIDPKAEFVIPYRSYSAIRLVWDRRIRKLHEAGQIKEKYTLHQLRKTCATYLLASGVNMIFVKAYLDHSDIRVTQEHYFELGLEEMRKDINQKAKFGFMESKKEEGKLTSKLTSSASKPKQAQSQNQGQKVSSLKAKTPKIA